jgi:probable HAF family extracellular repeat protein
MIERLHQECSRHPPTITASLVLCALWLAILNGPGHTQTIVFSAIPPLSGDNTAVASGISSDGFTVVGSSIGTRSQAIKWTSGGGTAALGFLTGLTAASYGLAVNNNGTSIFGGSEDSNQNVEAFAWTSGGMSVLSFPAGEYSNLATGSSSDGSVVVGYRSASSTTGIVAFRWNAGTGLFNLGMLAGDDGSFAFGVSADGSTVVGASANSAAGTQQAFIWTTSSGTMTPLGFLPGDNVSVAYGVSADGSVVVGMSGSLQTSGNPMLSALHAFRWTQSTGMVNLGTLSGDGGAIATAVSSDGNVVVGQSFGAGQSGGELFPAGSRAIVWTAKSGMQVIQDLLQSAGISVASSGISHLNVATGISADGTIIIGNGCSAMSCTAGWIATMPVPTHRLADTHDFNGDTYGDIAWRNNNGDTAIWLMTVTSGNAQILLAADYGLVPNSWQIVGQRDFNGDGKADLLWSNTNGDTSIWLMNGTTVSSTPDLGFVGNGWSIVGTGDFNGDGYGDILWRNTNGDTSIWLMTGNATQVQVLSTTDLGLVPTNWSVAQTGDFNGDGKADILWHNTNGDTSVWLMTASGTQMQVLSATDFGVVPMSWTIVGTGDFNADGKSDILWHNSNGDASIWLMTASGTQVQVLSATDLGLVPTSWNVAVTGDFNGDGMSDILWSNSNGDTSVWFMNGTVVSSASDLGVVPPSWVVQGATGAD